MTLEWLRRHDESWDALLRRFLFRDGPIAAEAEEEGDGVGAPEIASGDGSLAIGGRSAGAPR